MCFVFVFVFSLQTPPAGNKTQYEEIDIPVALLSYSDMLDISKVRSQLPTDISLLTLEALHLALLSLF